MGKCPSCGATSLRDSTWQCLCCGKIVCDKCVPKLDSKFLIKARMENTLGRPASYEEPIFCSDSCFRNFWLRVQEFPVDTEIGTEITDFSKKLVGLWNQTVLNAVAKSYSDVAEELVPKAEYAIENHTSKFEAFPWCDNTGKTILPFENFRFKTKLALAQNLEQCGRTQDAAKVFEELRMYDKPRELREKDKHIIIKKTDVSVNLNALLQQIKESGLVTVYRCPHCGGTLKIGKNTNLESLRKCEHCDSEIEITDLTDFLGAVLS